MVPKSWMTAIEKVIHARENLGKMISCVKKTISSNDPRKKDRSIPQQKIVTWWKFSAKRWKTAKIASMKNETINDDDITAHLKLTSPVSFVEVPSFALNHIPFTTIAETSWYYPGSAQNQHVSKNIVAFNNPLELASFDWGVLDNVIVGYRSTLKIQGKFHHRIGSLLPESGTEPNFGQLYFYDTDHELENRIKLLSD